MNPQIKTLLEIDKLDEEIVRLQDELKTIPEWLSEYTERASSAKARRDEAAEELKRKKLDQAALEGNLRDGEEAKNKLERHLNTVKKNDEYKKIKEDIAVQKAKNGEIETGILNLFEVIENQNTLLKSREKDFKEEDKLLAEKKAEFAGMAKEMQARLDVLNGKKKELMGRLDSEVSKRYARLFERFATQVVVPLEGGVCRGCFVKVTPQEMGRTMSGEEIVFCSKCGRIMYSR